MAFASVMMGKGIEWVEMYIVDSEKVHYTQHFLANTKSYRYPLRAGKLVENDDALLAHGSINYVLK